ncbi:MarR family transcriptional regulator [Mycobacterium botniense]|uniref:Uncharacterized protein n=1 Tax=Mycobacterium botniense TaxID=84962 RepID=A0A7I9XYZ3_9MYCO|nr:MarR family transcriptional regulator [Mycobacterium botniense]GFG74970.1 hypothetical protein MBOT_23350 [Mycobacterium botniense]
MSELTVLQAVRLKGRVTFTELAATLVEDAAGVAETVEQLIASGLMVGGAVLKLTDRGRARLSELLDEERTGVDATALAAVYDEFRPVNADFKAVATDWQLKAGEPNTHDDSDYDAAVLNRLNDLHQRAMAIIAAAAGHVPRLGVYAVKLQRALDKINSGETVWLTRPMIDSYHTVWFELHEELILVTGLTREDEASAGHAQ